MDRRQGRSGLIAGRFGGFFCFLFPCRYIVSCWPFCTRVFLAVPSWRLPALRCGPGFRAAHRAVDRQAGLVSPLRASILPSLRSADASAPSALRLRCRFRAFACESPKQPHQVIAGVSLPLRWPAIQRLICWRGTNAAFRCWTFFPRGETHSRPDRYPVRQTRAGRPALRTARQLLTASGLHVDDQGATNKSQLFLLKVLHAIDAYEIMQVLTEQRQHPGSRR